MRAARFAGDEAALLNARAKAQCITCRRPIDNIARRASESPERVAVLPEPDFCDWCGLALSARAVALEESFARPAQHELTVNIDTRGVGGR